MSDSVSNTDRRYKVGKVIDSYALDGIAAELEERWLGDGRESQSLRRLAEYFNKRVTEAALNETGEQPTNGFVANTYQLLTDDDVSSGERTSVRRNLERKGVDVDQLERDFVTHQAVHTFLTKGRDVSKVTESADRADRIRDTIQRLKSRVSAVTRTSVNQLAAARAITIGDFNVLVDVTVVCQDCSAHKTIPELLSDDGCDCQ
ncbi:rod-determining factor RdfA [Natrinema gelatinilyticum]|uniref:rod-determining factor RdfA n=1 Tax=Natrinema gelatinilyticum TaxID=2961571 RepID=UPI0020C3538A|nr:rod-determining factor RdfA [Natrinema gelatinilyticum]